MAAALRAYNVALQRRPLLAQCASGAVLFGAGDALAQQLVEKRGTKHDFMRTARLAFYGGAIFGPIVVHWYRFLNRLQSPEPWKAAVYRMFLDQFGASPALVALFFSSMSIMEGKGFSGISERMDKAYAPTVLRNWAVFIPTQLINFSVVPPHLRFVFVGVVSLFWNTYLSSVNASVDQEELRVRAAPELDIV